MKRRSFLNWAVIFFGLTHEKDHAMRPKQNIKYFEKIFSYLSDPELRLRENGDDLLVIKNAEISGVNFIELSWKNIHFVNCDFLGIYEIKLKDLKNTTFEDCFFFGSNKLGKGGLPSLCTLQSTRQNYCSRLQWQ